MASNADKIVEGLGKLDPNNDAHWTTEGLPRVEVVQEMAGLTSLTRKEITEAGRGFDRDVARSTTDEVDDLGLEEEQQDAAQQGPEAGQEAATSPSEATAGSRAEELQVAILEKRAAIANAESVIATARGTIITVTAVLQKLEQEFNELVPPLKQAEATQAWLKAEAERRAERVRQINERGLPSHFGKAQIDAVMRRPTGFGRQRPSRI
jgi:hypothetical protein